MNSARTLVNTAELRPIERKIQAVFVSGLFVLGLLRAVSHSGIEELLERLAWAEHGPRVMDTVRGMFGPVAEAGAAWRGSETTGNQGSANAQAD